MSGKVSSFDALYIGDFNYTFIVVTWNDFQSDIAEEIKKQVDPFGEALGLKGRVVEAFRSAKIDTASEILEKNWPEKTKTRMNETQDPMMLIINTDFKRFSPDSAPWAIIWFEDHRKDVKNIYRIFGMLANKTKKDEDIFQFLKSETRKKNFKKWLSFVEIKPGIFGFNVNAKALFEELI